MKAIALTAGCLLAGYGFYRANKDAVNAVFFTFGILGLLLSVLREGRKTKSSESDIQDR